MGKITKNSASGPDDFSRSPSPKIKVEKSSRNLKQRFFYIKKRKGLDYLRSFKQEVQIMLRQAQSTVLCARIQSANNAILLETQSHRCLISRLGFADWCEQGLVLSFGNFANVYITFDDEESRWRIDRRKARDVPVGGRDRARWIPAGGHRTSTRTSVLGMNRATFGCL